MINEESNFTGVRNCNIFYQKWLPESPKAIIQIVHGIGEHSSRYMNVVNALVPLGFGIYADDHRGHGRSEGQRNYVKTFDDYIEDEKLLNDIIKKEHPDIPIFMLGHSMGSVIAIYYVKAYAETLKGFILSGMGNDVGGDVSGFLRFMAKILSVLAPKLMVDQGDLSQFLSHDPAVVEKYNSDPLVYAAKTSAKLGADLMKYFQTYKEFAGNFTIPLLIVTGGADKLVIGSREAVDYFKMEDKTVHIYEGLYHEVFNELEEDRNKVLADVKKWLESHV